MINSLANENFLKRVMLFSLVFAALGGGVFAAIVSPRWGLGFLIAAVWSVLNLKALEQLIRLAVRPTGRDPLAIAVAMLIKVPVLYGIGVLIAIKVDLPAESLIAGFSVPLAVIVLKAAGQVMAPSVALPDREIETRDNGTS
jgi:hypothetical protein